MTSNTITIKILGSEAQVKKTLDLVEKVFPLYVVSELLPNGDGVGVHVFLKVALPLEAQQ